MGLVPGPDSSPPDRMPGGEDRVAPHRVPVGAQEDRARACSAVASWPWAWPWSGYGDPRRPAAGH